MATLAKLIVVDMRAHTLTIDSQEFPWHVGEHWTVTGDGLPALNIAIIAERIEVVNE